MDQEERPLFNDWLARHGRGVLNAEATAALSDVVQAVSDIGKKGKITLEIVVEPAGAGGRTVAIGGRVKAAPPSPDPELGIFYVGSSGSLHRDDPYVQRIPGVPFEDHGEIKVVDAESGEVRRVEDGQPSPVALEADGPAREETDGD